ncbi:Leucine Rich repeats (2 copies) [Gemmata sp. SH-PL17]|uniref:leucine-rich repeat domain-containing protein n=1 Tax=Gemmata sp. SH-PL17 TaxID=1630693 RepID=UPI00078C13D2|nr:hypothetical protein [Gemmata sp. SH-PL17]AMV27846.1 Leucine Rich repeats (2 copies) [Gemmata sp. SH-PL17]
MKSYRFHLIAAACVTIASTAVAQEQKEPPKLDEATIKAWADQGAKLEWLSIVDGQLRYDSRPPARATQLLPVFAYSGKGDVGATDFTKLPVPQIPFGVRLFNEKKGVGAALKNLAGVKNLSGLAVSECVATEKEWQALGAFKQLTLLDVSGGYQRDTRPPESVLKLLKDCKALETLAIHGMRLTEAGVKNLTELKQVRRLVASGTGLSDALLKELKSMERLEELDLSFTAVTDMGVTVLKDFKALKVLSLASTKITDTCVKDLDQFSKLKVLNVFNTKVSKTGLDALRKALPNCTIKD